VTCDEDDCLNMDHVDGVRPDVEPVGGDVLPVLAHKRRNKAHLQQKIFIFPVTQKIHANLLYFKTSMINQFKDQSSHL
jgi:hypothetical protein